MIPHIYPSLQKSCGHSFNYQTVYFYEDVHFGWMVGQKLTIFVCQSKHYPCFWLCQIVIRNLWLDIFCEIPNPQTIKTASSINHQHNHVVEHFVWCFLSLFCFGQRYRLLWWILILNWPFGHRGWWTVHKPTKPIQSDSITNIGPRHVTCPVSGVQASLLHLNVNRQKVTLT